MALKIQIRNGTASTWTSTNPILAANEPGIENDTGRFKIGDGSTAWNSLAYRETQGPTQTLPFRSLGDGSDGNVTISSGTTTLSRDMFYNNLTMSGTGILITNGYRVFVKNILNISNASAGAIQCNGNSGGNASGATGGIAGAALNIGTIATGGLGGSGATATSGAGTSGGAGDGNLTPNNGGTGGASGDGGAGTNAAGNGSASVGVQQTFHFKRFETNLMVGATLVSGGINGRGGASGGGDGTNSGGGGGAGGGGGGVVALYVNAIVKSSSTPSNTIQALGGNGGNGGNSLAGNTGGGGGGGAGGGGWVYLAYNFLFGPVITNLIFASGGNGGNGGKGIGTGLGGDGGNAAMPGKISILSITNNAAQTYLGSESTALTPELIGMVNFGSIGGNGGFNATLSASL